jgi:N-acyl-D-aspartate/D-glutamate deacylase
MDGTFRIVVGQNLVVMTFATGVASAPRGELCPKSNAGRYARLAAGHVHV